MGYYLNNEYEDPELRENPPEVPHVDKLTRSILASDPRVTRFPCDFDAPPAEEAPPPGQEGEELEDDDGMGALEGEDGLVEEEGEDEEDEDEEEEGAAGAEEDLMDDEGDTMQVRA